MTKLSDTQTIILSRAAQNEDRIALPLPDSLRGEASVGGDQRDAVAVTGFAPDRLAVAHVCLDLFEKALGDQSADNLFCSPAA